MIGSDKCWALEFHLKISLTKITIFMKHYLQVLAKPPRSRSLTSVQASSGIPVVLYQDRCDNVTMVGSRPESLGWPSSPFATARWCWAPPATLAWKPWRSQTAGSCCRQSSRSQASRSRRDCAPSRRSRAEAQGRERRRDSQRGSGPVVLREVGEEHLHTSETHSDPGKGNPMNEFNEKGSNVAKGHLHMVLDQSETFLNTSGVTRFMNHWLAHYCLLRARAVGYLPASVRAIFAVGLRHRMMLRCAVERSRDIYMLAQAGVAEKGSD